MTARREAPAEASLVAELLCHELGYKLLRCTVLEEALAFKPSR